MPSLRSSVPRASALSRSLAGIVTALVLLLAASAAVASGPEWWLLDPGIEDPAADRVLSGALDPYFGQLLPRRTVLQPSPDPRWLRLALPPNPDQGSRVLAISRLPMRVLDVHLPDGQGGYSHASRSFFAPDPLRFSPSAFVFELPASLDEGGIAYLRIVQGGRLYLGMEVLAADQLARSERQFATGITAGITTLAVMLLVNLVFMLALRERLYGYYVAFLAAQMLWVLFATGIAFLLPILDQAGNYPGSLSGVLITLSNALMLQFARHYVELPQRHPRLDWAIQGLLVAFISLSLAFLLPIEFATRWVGLVASAVFLMLPLLLLPIMLRAWAGGSREAGLFLFAWLPLGALGAHRTLVGFGLFEPGAFTLYLPLLAVAFEAVALSLALAWRVLQLRIQRDRAQYQADYDVLTGGLSRRAGEQRLRAELASSIAASRPLSVLFVDLDHLKEINDIYSHYAGDACLRELGTRVRTELAGRGELIRWGGDEFLVMLPDCGPQAASLLAERICRAVREPPVKAGDVELVLATSLGVASAALTDADFHTLVQRADRALYNAKRDGRNRVAVAEPRWAVGAVEA
jgi:diguanylate cyclase (GGDEF)-like protein